MQVVTTYVSELGRSFATSAEALADDARLPGIIRTYESDLERMEAGLEVFGSEPVTEDLKRQWRNAIAGYKAKWEVAKLTQPTQPA